MTETKAESEALPDCWKEALIYSSHSVPSHYIVLVTKISGKAVPSVEQHTNTSRHACR